MLAWSDGRLDLSPEELVDYCSDTVADMVRRRTDRTSAASTGDTSPNVRSDPARAESRPDTA